MITLRVRTNLGGQRIQVPVAGTRVSNLIETIRNKLNISTSEGCPIILAHDLAGNNRMTNLEALITGEGDTESLKNGDEVYVLGKFEEVVVKQSYVNDKHEVIQAGKSIKMIEPPESRESNSSGSDTGIAANKDAGVTAKATATIPPPTIEAGIAAEVTPNMRHSEPPKPSSVSVMSSSNAANSKNIKESSASGSVSQQQPKQQPVERSNPQSQHAKTEDPPVKKPSLPEIDYNNFKFEGEDEEDVRSPDQVRQMQLMHDPTAALSEEVSEFLCLISQKRITFRPSHCLFISRFL
jgi:hypothetical protein